MSPFTQPLHANLIEISYGAIVTILLPILSEWVTSSLVSLEEMSLSRVIGTLVAIDATTANSKDTIHGYQMRFKALVRRESHGNYGLRRVRFKCSVKGFRASH